MRALVFFLGIHCVSAYGDPFTELSSLPLTRCTVSEVIGRLKYEPMQKAAAIADQQLGALNEMGAITKRFEGTNRPMSELMTSDEVARFSEVRQRMMAMQLAGLVESRRERDLEVLWQLVQLADKNYRWGERLSENDPNFILQGLLDLWR